MRYYVRLIKGPKGKGETEYRDRILDIWGLLKGSNNLDEFKKHVREAAKELYEHDTLEIWDSKTDQLVRKFRKEIVGGYIVIKPY